MVLPPASVLRIGSRTFQFGNRNEIGGKTISLKPRCSQGSGAFFTSNSPMTPLMGHSALGCVSIGGAVWPAPLDGKTDTGRTVMKPAASFRGLPTQS